MSSHRWSTFVIRGFVFIVSLTLVFVPRFVQAQDGSRLWSDGIQLDSAFSPHTLMDLQVISDGAGGAIYVWTYVTDLNPTTYSADLYAQRIDSGGNKLWGPDGTWVNYMPMAQRPAIVTDGSGGVIVTWVSGREDAGGYTIYAQRLDQNGNRKWTAGGYMNDVQISNSFGAFSGLDLSFSPGICTDRIGGAFISWGSRLTHVTARGSVAPYGVDGIELVPGGSGSFQMISDGTGGLNPKLFPFPTRPEAGGLYAVWVSGSAIYAQRVKAGPQWGTNGILVRQFGVYDTVGTLSLSLTGPGIGPNLLIAWSEFDYTSPPTRAQVRVQKLNSSGTRLWRGGVVVVDSQIVGGNPYDWQMYAGKVAVTHDGSSGAIVSWTDGRNLSQYPYDQDLYAQCLDSEGARLWTTNGVLLPPYIVGDRAPGSQGAPLIVSDLEGGAVVVYQDLGGFSWDIAGTRLDSNGTKLWSQWIYGDSKSSSNPGYDQTSPVIDYDGSTSSAGPPGVVIGWYESRSSQHLLYAQKVEIPKEP